jgi:hypothetical protein
MGSSRLATKKAAVEEMKKAECRNRKAEIGKAESRNRGRITDNKTTGRKAETLKR